jgi:hypothetical protein
MRNISEKPRNVTVDLFPFNQNCESGTVFSRMKSIQLPYLAARSFCIFSVIAIAGCTDSGSGDFFGHLFAARPVETAPPTPEPVRPHPVAVAPAAPDVEAGVKPRRPAAKRPAEIQTAAVPTPADLAVPPPKLIGLTEQETVTLLGPPSAQWDRPPAKVWHYQGPDCAVDVFFYLDVSRNEFSALRTMAATGDGVAPAAAGGASTGGASTGGASNSQQCLTRIRDVAQRK